MTNQRRARLLEKLASPPQSSSAKFGVVATPGALGLGRMSSGGGAIRLGSRPGMQLTHPRPKPVDKLVAASNATSASLAGGGAFTIAKRNSTSDANRGPLKTKLPPPTAGQRAAEARLKVKAPTSPKSAELFRPVKRKTLAQWKR